MTPMLEQQIRMYKNISAKMGDLMFTLYGRWLDEREFEDFKEYENVMKQQLEKVVGVRFVKAQKRPFGFRYKFLGKTPLFFLKSHGNSKYSLSLQL